VFCYPKIKGLNFGEKEKKKKKSYTNMHLFRCINWVNN
jgi:hypothetical protein